MTQPTPESGGTQGGTPAQPNAGTSQGASDSTSEQVTITKAQWDSLLNTIKTLQSEDRSAKDRAVRGVNERIGKLEESVNPLLERAAELMKEGKSSKEAIATVNSEYEDRETSATLREFALAWKSGNLQLGNGAGNTAPNSVNAAEVFGQILGQDAIKNPLLAPYLAKQYASADEATAAAKQLFYDLSRLPNPNPAQSASLQGGQTGVSNLDALATEYEALSENPAANFERMSVIQKEIDAAIK